MEHIYRVVVNYMKKVNHEKENLPGWIPDWKIIAKDECNRIFLNEEDAKGYCNLMNKYNEYGNKCNLYCYFKEEICTKDFKEYA